MRKIVIKARYRGILLKNSIAHLHPLIPLFTIKEKGGHHMFSRKKKEKFYVGLNSAEVRLLIKALMNFRNKCMALGKPTEDINDLLLMVMK